MSPMMAELVRSNPRRIALMLCPKAARNRA